MRTVDRDHAVLRAVSLDDGDRARLDDEEVIAGIPLTEQHVAGRHRAHLAGGTQPCALLAVKTRKGTVAIEGLIHAHPERLAHRGLSITNITSSR